MEEKQEENGDAFDREAYLRNVEEFEDVEIVVPGRTVSKVNRKHVNMIILFSRTFLSCNFYFQNNYNLCKIKGTRRKIISPLRATMGEGLFASPIGLDCR